MNELFLKIINMSISASWLVLAVVILRFVLKKAPKWINVLLWGIVAIRLICPFSFESVLSLIPSAETIPLNIGMNTAAGCASGDVSRAGNIRRSSASWRAKNALRMKCPSASWNAVRWLPEKVTEAASEMTKKLLQMR